MFGEERMYGQTNISLDVKRRMNVPTFTKAEQNERLVIVNEGDFFSIYEKNHYLEQIKDLEEQYSKTTNMDERRKMHLELLKFYQTILKEVVVDKQRRFVLGPNFEPNENLCCIGAGDHIILLKQK